MWAAGMAGIRLPSMMPGLRMEEGTVTSGGLETWTILEGLPGWSRAGAKARAAKDGKGLSLLCAPSRGWGRGLERQREDSPTSSAGEKMGRNFKSVSRRQQQNIKIKNNKLDNCSIADLLPRGIV